METKVSLPCLQDTATCPRPEPDQSSPCIRKPPLKFEVHGTVHRHIILS
jgi:hypothetical protein